MSQTKWESVKEAVTNTGVAFTVSLLFHKLLVADWQVEWVNNGRELTDWWAAVWITVFYTVMSLLRNYIIRRCFNKDEK